MERIKQALERARTERQSALGSATAPPPPTSAGEGGPAPAAPTAAAPADAPVRPLDPAHLRANRIITGDEGDAVLTTFKLLRTQVLRQLRANQWHLLGVTSPSEGNGKTLTAINLSISLAREVNQSVILVDLDLRRPSVGAALYSEPLPGLSAYLEGEQDFAELFVHPGMERLLVLPADRAYASSSELLTAPKIRALVEALKNRQPKPIVIVDLPPILGGDDVMAFAPQLDALLLVVEEGQTQTEELRHAYELIGEHPILGTVLNKSQDRPAAYYGYGYPRSNALSA